MRKIRFARVIRFDRGEKALTVSDSPNEKRPSVAFQISLVHQFVGIKEAAKKLLFTFEKCNFKCLYECNSKL